MQQQNSKLTNPPHQHHGRKHLRLLDSDDEN